MKSSSASDFHGHQKVNNKVLLLPSAQGTAGFIQLTKEPRSSEFLQSVTSPSWTRALRLTRQLAMVSFWLSLWSWPLRRWLFDLVTFAAYCHFKLAMVVGHTSGHWTTFGLPPLKSCLCRRSFGFFNSCLTKYSSEILWLRGGRRP